MAKKVYATLELSEEELKLARQSVIRHREVVFDKYMKASGKNDKEVQFYQDLLAELDALLAMIQKPFDDDTSQDDDDLQQFMDEHSAETARREMGE